MTTQKDVLHMQQILKLRGQIDALAAENKALRSIVDNHERSLGLIMRDLDHLIRTEAAKADVSNKPMSEQIGAKVGSKLFGWAFKFFGSKVGL